MQKNLTRDQPVPGGIEMDPIPGQSETRIVHPLFSEVSFHRAVNIDDIPTFILLREQPLRVAHSTAS